jgi:hypothetical protein
MTRAMQRCPVQPDIAASTPPAAISGSASGSTMTWFLAPPRASTRLKAPQPRAYTAFATRVEPTKLTAWIPGWSQIASTASRPPCTTLNTPSGRPATLSSSAIRPADNGTSSDGFRMKALPSAMALGMDQCGTIDGKLNGLIEATTPSGCRSSRHSTPRLTSITSPTAICGSEQANSVSSMALRISASASLLTLPCSSVMSAPSSVRCRSSSALYR